MDPTSAPCLGKLIDCTPGFFLGKTIVVFEKIPDFILLGPGEHDDIFARTVCLAGPETRLQLVEYKDETQLSVSPYPLHAVDESPHSFCHLRHTVTVIVTAQNCTWRSGVDLHLNVLVVVLLRREFGVFDGFLTDVD